MAVTRVGVIFGGRSVEHEVSVITAAQAMAALDRERFQPVPIYIAKSGRWYTGERLLDLDAYRDPETLVAGAEPVMLSTDPDRSGLVRQERRSTGGGGLFRRGGDRGGPDLVPLDVVMPLVHGSHGEDGTLQGLCELADIAYCGSDVVASGLSMDKVLGKAVLRNAGLPVLDDLTVTRSRWRADSDGVRAEVAARFGWPVFIKPMCLGSSIGVSRVGASTELTTAMEVAAAYQDRILVEPAQDGIVEVNCAVLGDAGGARASVCEQPVSAGVLSYEDKYLQGGKADPRSGAKARDGMGGARRLIPAPLEAVLSERIQATAVAAFLAINASGVARVDFLVRPERGEVILNEINTIPGSLSFYLWEPVGLPFPALCTELIDIAQRRHIEKQASTYSIDSWLLHANPLAGGKTGAKRA